MVNIRSKEEIKKIAFSCQIVADTLIMLEEFIKPGQSILELDKKLKILFYQKELDLLLRDIWGFPLLYVFL